MEATPLRLVLLLAVSTAAAEMLPDAHLPTGIISVLNTPFTPDGSAVDCASLAKNVDLAIDSGVAGFLVPAMAAEVTTLTGAERRAMVTTVVKGVAQARQRGEQAAADGCDRL